MPKDTNYPVTVPIKVNNTGTMQDSSYTVVNSYPVPTVNGKPYHDMQQRPDERIEYWYFAGREGFPAGGRLEVGVLSEADGAQLTNVTIGSKDDTIIRIPGHQTFTVVSAKLHDALKGALKRVFYTEEDADKPRSQAPLKDMQDLETLRKEIIHDAGKGHLSLSNISHIADMAALIEPANIPHKPKSQSHTK